MRWKARPGGLEMAIWGRRDLEELIHHSDGGGQYLAIRYTERLGEQGALHSVRFKGDSYDNDLADTIISLYKTELIRRRDPWKGLDDVEYATLECVDWSTPPALGADRLRSARRV